MKIIRAKLPIRQPGIYSGISLDDYHSAKVIPEGEYAVSSTDLRLAWSKSLAHCVDQWAHNPNRKPREETRPMLLGRAAHHLLLGEDRFSTEFIAQPTEYRDLKTAQYKPWHNGADVCKEWNAQQARAGRTIVKQDELEKIIGMAKSLALEPLVKDGILEGAVECSGFVKHPPTGLWVKIRPDVIPTRSGDIVDVKTIADITDRGIKSRIREASYHMQAGLMWLAFELLGFNFESFTLVFLESDRPFCTRMIPLEDEDLARGRQQCELMLRKVAECIALGSWPGPGQGELKSLWLPVEERLRIDARLQSEGMI